MRIFVTGKCGLIGRAVCDGLKVRGVDVVGCDLRAQADNERFDLRNANLVRRAMNNCDGVVHFGALSRVVWGQQYPDLCRSINIEGAQTVMQAAAESPRKPWLLFAGSREIYGTPAKLPCSPESPPNPENVYAKTKLTAEQMAFDLRRHGNRSAVLRFSNVFGSVDDYHDRVAPAFAKAAASGGDLHVRGADGVYDFTVLADVAVAVLNAMDLLDDGVGDLPPIDIVTGRAVSLLEMAKMAVENGSGNIIIEPPLGFYPKCFQGDPRPAEKYLGWKPEHTLEDAMRRLVGDFRKTESNHAHIKSDSWVSALV